MSVLDMLFPSEWRGGTGAVDGPRVSHARSLIADGQALVGGGASSVEDAGGGADIHVERDAVVGVTRHPGHVGGVELPGEQRRGAEHVPQAVPGPRPLTRSVTPAGGQVGAL